MIDGVLSQSLWNRAVSYDVTTKAERRGNLVSIPLEQGSVLRQRGRKDKEHRSPVSIPLEQGSVLRPLTASKRATSSACLNPFGTGQCLTTNGE